MAARSAKSNSNKTDRLADRWASARAEAYRSLDEFSRQLRARGIDPSKIIRNELETCTSKTFPQNTLVEMYTEWCTLRDRWFDYYELRDEWEVASRRMENELRSLDAAEAAELRNLFGGRCDFDVSVNGSGVSNNPDDYRLGKKYLRGRTRYRRKRAKLIELMTVPSIRVPNGWEGPRGPAYEITSLTDVEAWLQRELHFAQNVQYLDSAKQTDGLTRRRGSMARCHLNKTVRNLFRLFSELGTLGLPKEPAKSAAFHVAEIKVIRLLADVRERLAAEDQNNLVPVNLKSGSENNREQGDDAESRTPQDQTFVFRISENMVLIAGFGELGRFPRLKGFKQIMVLIRATSRPVSMLELTEPTLDEGIAQDVRSRQPSTDAKALADYKKRLAELDSDIAKEQANNNPSEVGRLESEKRELISHIRSSVGLGGQGRDLNSLADKLRPRISGTIKTAIGAMRKAKPPMLKVADHFDASITSEGICFVYRPPSGSTLKWELD